VVVIVLQRLLMMMMAISHYDDVMSPFKHPSIHYLILLPYTTTRYWAIAIPSYLWVVYIMIGVVYAGMNLLITAPLESFDTFTGR